MSADLFDGSVDLYQYERSAFEPLPCELLAFESYHKYTLTRLSFSGSDVYLFILRARVEVLPMPGGVFAGFISGGTSLAFSIGGAAYISGGKAVQTAPHETGACFAGFDSGGVMKLTPDGVLSAIDSGIVHGAEASPFLIVHGKRLAIKDHEKRRRDRLLVGQLCSGEPTFIYAKTCDISSAAAVAFQLGCACAAVIGNDGCIDICAQGLMLNRQSGCGAAFVIR
jgi:hypothetical protein